MGIRSCWKWPRNGMRDIKSRVLQLTHINSLYSFLCIGSFPHKKGVGEDDLDSSMEAVNREKLVSFLLLSSLLLKLPGC